MSKPAAFTQSDITRLIRGARAAGATVTRVEVDKLTGNLVASFGEPGDNSSPEDDADEWSRTIAKNKERASAQRH